jgi:hypothetical protein
VNGNSPYIYRRSFRARVLATCLAMSVLVARGAVVIGPWLEGDSTTNVDVLVECDSAATMTVNYGTTTNYDLTAATSVCWTNSQAGADFIHRIRLNGLRPDTLYHYQLAGQGTSSADFNFGTMPLTNMAATIKLADAPVAVSNAVTAVAGGRAVEKINRVNHLTGAQFYAYVADTLGPQLVVVDGQGSVLINAEVEPFANLSQASQAAVRAAVAGRLQVCRRAGPTAGPFVLEASAKPFVVDYIIGEEEPVFALIRETDGWVRACYGYLEGDGDEE